MTVQKDRRDKLPAGHEFAYALASWASDNKLYLNFRHSILSGNRIRC
jgi:hypothetical protein